LHVQIKLAKPGVRNLVLPVRGTKPVSLENLVKNGPKKKQTFSHSLYRLVEMSMRAFL
jgi:hypothetical protein